MDEEQLRQLQQELKNAKSEYTKAKKVLENISSLEIRYQKTAELISSVTTNVQNAQSEIDRTAQKIKVTNDEIRQIRTEISTYLESANTNIQELQTLSARASELKGTIEGRSGEIDALLKSARVFSADIEKLKESAQGNLDKSNTLLEDFQNKVAVMQLAHTEFLQIQAKIEDKNTGLKAALAFVQQTQQQSEEILKAIQVLRVTATEEVAQINKLKKQSEEGAQKVNESVEFANEKKLQVEQVSGLVIDGSFAETFERRKKEINKNLNSDWFSWKNILLVSVFILVGAVFLPFVSYLSDSFNFGMLAGVDGFFIRFFYTSPLIFLVVFSATQYSKERQFLEKYAFKAVSAAAVRNHIEFLRERFSEKEVSKFSIGVFNSIYSEPFKAEIADKSISKISLFNKKKGSDPQGKNLIEIIDSLYDLVPEEIAVKQIVETVADLRKNVH